MTEDKISSALSVYKGKYLSKGSELLFRPKEAVDFARDLAKARVGFIGINIWRSTPVGIKEELGGLDLSDLYSKRGRSAGRVEISLGEVERYLNQFLPEGIDYVSLVIFDADDPQQDG
jgi:hypothetical protein